MAITPELRDEILALSRKHMADKREGPKHTEVRRNECERKVRYTRAMAKYAARHISRRTEQAAIIYHCKSCGFWHVGNKSGRAK